MRMSGAAARTGDLRKQEYKKCGKYIYKVPRQTLGHRKSDRW